MSRLLLQLFNHCQVSGSHDFSLRLWGRTQEPLVLSEERENVSTFPLSTTPIFINILSQLDISAIVPSPLQEREAQFEEAVAEGGGTVVRGDL